MCLDDSRVRKAYLGKKFRINLAFFRNIATTLPLLRDYDFTQFKQMPKPHAPRNVASASAIDPSKLKPIPFILDSSVPECKYPENVKGTQFETQPHNVPDTGDQEQRAEQETPLETDPPDVPEKDNQEPEHEQETPLETDPSDVPETSNQEPETEKETPLEAHTHDVPENDNQEPQPEQGTQPSQDTSENSSKLVGHIEFQSVAEFKQELSEKVMTPRFLVVCLQKYPNLLKRFQEGTVRPTKLRSQFSRLCQI